MCLGFSASVHELGLCTPWSSPPPTACSALELIFNSSFQYVRQTAKHYIVAQTTDQFVFIRGRILERQLNNLRTCRLRVPVKSLR